MRAGHGPDPDGLGAGDGAALLTAAPGRDFARALAAAAPAPDLALAVSGGPDSMALALLAQAWTRARGGTLRGFIVDHRLRAESAAEAALTQARLAGRGIAAEILVLEGLAPGPALAERARAARYAALAAACARAGLRDLLLGHHRADQAETVLLRALAGSGPAGLAGMPLVGMRGGIRLIRPLLGIAPGALRALLRAAGLGWVEDPSNQAATAQRARLRALRADAAGEGPASHALAAAARALGAARAEAERETAAWIAAHARLHPEGFAVLPPGPWPAAALARLIRWITGRDYAPRGAALQRLAAAPRGATLGGARLLPAGRLGPGWLLAREAAAMAAPVPAEPGARWDNRFALEAGFPPGSGLALGALGADAARLRRLSPLPAALLATLPALRGVTGQAVAVPHLGLIAGPAWRFAAAPPRHLPAHPAADLPFLPPPA